MTKTTTTPFLLFLLLLLQCNKSAAKDFGDFMSDLANNILGGDQDNDKRKNREKGGKAAVNDVILPVLQSNPVLSPVFGNLENYVSLNPTTEVTQGRKIFQCITQDDASSFGRKRISSFLQGQFIEAIAMGVLYHIFLDSGDIAVICPEASSSSEETREQTTSIARGAQHHDNQQHHNLRRRKLQEPADGTVPVGATPNYPVLDPDDVYRQGMVFHNKQIVGYLNSGDLNNRLAIGRLVDDLNDQIVVYRQASQTTEAAGQTVYAMGDLISTLVADAGGGVITVAGAEIGVGSAVRGLGEFLQGIGTAVMANLARRQRALLRISNHKTLIDSAEIEATYLNSQMLLGQITSLQAKVAEMENAQRK